MKRPTQKGVSLVEALVALAVMAFGMLGLVGMQSSMRLNADIAKQRAEAVRIAQEQIETWRAFTTLDQYRDGIVSIPDTAAVSPNNTNTAYRIVANVTPGPTNPPTIPPVKAAVVSVTWIDRSNSNQGITLTTRIAASDAVIGAALAVPPNGGPAARPWGRHPSIPPLAIPQSDGTSRYAPPGLGDVGWVFSNTTGFIIQLCDETFTTCTSSNLLLLTGYVRYATRTTPLPSPFEAENPVFTPNFPESIGVRVDLTNPTGTVDCAIDQRNAYTIYYCALPLSLFTNPASWSGRAELRGFNIASDQADSDSSRYRVCRYTTERNNTPAGGNLAHPLDYNLVSAPLYGQNYLIIRAGDDITAFTCPGDDTSTPYVNGNTYDHQPPRL